MNDGLSGWGRPAHGNPQGVHCHFVVFSVHSKCSVVILFEMVLRNFRLPNHTGALSSPKVI